MSFHVFIARAGFKDNPISQEDWLSSASQCAELRVEEHTNRNSKRFHTVTLKDERLHLTPHGLIDAQEPSKELIVVMFRIAGLLGAGVYSEQLHQYSSPDDWAKRTAKARQARAGDRDARRTASRRRAVFYALVVIAGAIIGWAVSS